MRRELKQRLLRLERRDRPVYGRRLPLVVADGDRKALDRARAKGREACEWSAAVDLFV